MVTKPTVNRAARSRKELFKLNYAALEAVQEAHAALCEATPHGRDYQTVSEFDEAQREHADRRKKLESVIAELDELSAHVSG